jgi:hypothetical protein
MKQLFLSTPLLLYSHFIVKIQVENGAKKDSQTKPIFLLFIHETKSHKNFWPGTDRKI